MSNKLINIYLIGYRVWTEFIWQPQATAAVLAKDENFHLNLHILLFAKWPVFGRFNKSYAIDLFSFKWVNRVSHDTIPIYRAICAYVSISNKGLSTVGKVTHSSSAQFRQNQLKFIWTILHQNQSKYVCFHSLSHYWYTSLCIIIIIVIVIVKGVPNSVWICRMTDKTKIALNSTRATLFRLLFIQIAKKKVKRRLVIGGSLSMEKKKKKKRDSDRVVRVKAKRKDRQRIFGDWVKFLFLFFFYFNVRFMPFWKKVTYISPLARRHVAEKKRNVAVSIHFFADSISSWAVFANQGESSQTG